MKISRIISLKRVLRNQGKSELWILVIRVIVMILIL
jgi:hypothetical protein